MTVRIAEKPPSVVVPLRQGIVTERDALQREVEQRGEAYLFALFTGAPTLDLRNKAEALYRALDAARRGGLRA